jgi:hypothetical protein
MKSRHWVIGSRLFEKKVMVSSSGMEMPNAAILDISALEDETDSLPRKTGNRLPSDVTSLPRKTATSATHRCEKLKKRVD